VYNKDLLKIDAYVYASIKLKGSVLQALSSRQVTRFTVWALE
jgi:hypothetical protein